MTALPEKRAVSADELKQYPEGVRAELIDGTIYEQAAPSRRHQKIAARLFTAIQNHIDASGRPCEVYFAPFAVYLGSDYVEPDLSVICDSSTLTERGCEGAPDWILEIVSPSTAANDYIRKLYLYERSGVREYWIVNPDRRTVRTYIFPATEYNSREYSFDDQIPVSISEDFAICLADL